MMMMMKRAIPCLKMLSMKALAVLRCSKVHLEFAHHIHPTSLCGKLYKYSSKGKKQVKENLGRSLLTLLYLAITFWILHSAILTFVFWIFFNEIQDFLVLWITGYFTKTTFKLSTFFLLYIDGMSIVQVIHVHSVVNGKTVSGVVSLFN